MHNNIAVSLVFLLLFIFSFFFYVQCSTDTPVTQPPTNTSTNTTANSSVNIDIGPYSQVHPAFALDYEAAILDGNFERTTTEGFQSFPNGVMDESTEKEVHNFSNLKTWYEDYEQEQHYIWQDLQVEASLIPSFDLIDYTHYEYQGNWEIDSESRTLRVTLTWTKQLQLTCNDDWVCEYDRRTKKPISANGGYGISGGLSSIVEVNGESLGCESGFWQRTYNPVILTANKELFLVVYTRVDPDTQEFLPGPDATGIVGLWKYQQTNIYNENFSFGTAYIKQEYCGANLDEENVSYTTRYYNFKKYDASSDGFIGEYTRVEQGNEIEGAYNLINDTKSPETDKVEFRPFAGITYTSDYRLYENQDEPDYLVFTEPHVRTND